MFSSGPGAQIWLGRMHVDGDRPKLAYVGPNQSDLAEVAPQVANVAEIAQCRPKLTEVAPQRTQTSAGNGQTCPTIRKKEQSPKSVDVATNIQSVRSQSNKEPRPKFDRRADTIGQLDGETHRCDPGPATSPPPTSTTIRGPSTVTPSSILSNPLHTLRFGASHPTLRSPHASVCVGAKYHLRTCQARRAFTASLHATSERLVSRASASSENPRIWTSIHFSKPDLEMELPRGGANKSGRARRNP